MRKVFYVLPLLLLTLLISVNDTVAQAGSPDATFGTSGVTTAVIAGNNVQIVDMAIQPADGKVVMVGYTEDPAPQVVVVRFNTDGTLDGTFDGDGILIPVLPSTANVALGVAIQSDGKIIVAGGTDVAISADVIVFRLNEDGSFDDANFGAPNGYIVTDVNAGSYDYAIGVAIQSDGQIVVGASAGNADNNFAALRYNPDGTLDTGFDTDGKVFIDLNGGSEDYPNKIILQSDGKLVMAGRSGSGAASDFALLRLNTNGSVDPGFDTDGILILDISGASLQDEATDIAYDANDNLVVVGFANNSTDEDIAVIRLNGTDGSYDLTFNLTGIVLTDNIAATNNRASAVAIQSDNKIVVAGSIGDGEFNVLRYTTAGALDVSFDTDGVASINAGSADEASTIRLYHERIYVGGITSNAGDRDFALAALLNDASALPLNILSFTAQKQNNHVALNWTTEKEVGITQFIVERSTDGRTFSPIGHLPPAKNNTIVKDYTFYDQNPLDAVNYYRLAIREVDENIIYSKILAIKFNRQATTGLEVFPNPVINNSLRMQLPDGLTGRVNVQVLDATGRIVKRMSVQANGGSSIATSLDVSSLQKGVYFIKLESTGTVITKRFLKN